MPLDQRKINERLDYWTKRLRLTGWRVRVELLDRPMSDCWAKVEVDHDRECAKIILGSDVEPEDLDFNLVHELVHVAMAHADQIVSEACGKLGAAGDVAFSHYRRYIETAVNRIAEAIVGKEAKFQL